MKKINILYVEDYKLLINELAIVIDGKDCGDIKKNTTASYEVEEGVHRLQIGTAIIKDINKQGASVEQNLWIDEDVDVNNEDLYYILKTPFIITKKGKLKRVSKEKYERRSKQNKFWTSSIGVAIIIIILLIIEFIF